MAGIEFPRIKGGKPFDTNTEWFKTMLKEIGQTNDDMEAYPVKADKAASPCRHYTCALLAHGKGERFQGGM